MDDKQFVSGIRRSVYYRCCSYATYISLILSLINYKIFAGTSNALLGIFIALILIMFSVAVPGMFLVLASIKDIKRDPLSSHKTNIIHDLGVIIYVIIALGITLAFLWESVGAWALLILPIMILIRYLFITHIQQK